MSSHGEDKSFDAVGLSKGVGSGARFPIADRFWNAKRVSPWLICYFPGPFSANDDALIIGVIASIVFLVGLSWVVVVCRLFRYVRSGARLGAED